MKNSVHNYNDEGKGKSQKYLFKFKYKNHFAYKNRDETVSAVRISLSIFYE